MPNFLALLQAIDASTPLDRIIPIQPRSKRRQELRDAAKSDANKASKVSPAEVIPFPHPTFFNSGNNKTEDRRS